MTAYDCSQPIESGMPVYPGDDPVAVERFCTVPDDGSCIRDLSLTTHTGTHIDAPSHKVADGPSLDSFDVSAFSFDARVVDCTPCRNRERLTVGCLPTTVDDDVEMLLFRTGWDEHWGSERYRDSPYLGQDVAEWCVERGLHVGIDAFSPDPVPSADPTRERDDEPTDQPAHAILCGADRLILENLRGLDRLPDCVRLDAQPLAVVDADGSPVRAVARTTRS